MNDKDNIHIILECVAIGAMKQFIDDRSESFFLLENNYVGKLHALNQNVSSHTTRFAQKLEEADIIQKHYTTSNIS